MDMKKVSSGHTSIKPTNIPLDLLDGWKNQNIPLRQRVLADQAIQEAHKNQPNILFTIVQDFLRKGNFTQDSSILETGCSTGYYYEVLSILFQTKLKYTGVDYSEAMIQKAKEYYSTANFIVADGANLPFSDNEFDFVILGSILIHVSNALQHISEATRVSKQYVILHRSIACKSKPTQYLKKLAYEVPVFEIHYNENELLEMFKLNKLELVDKVEYVVDVKNDEYHASYLFKKV
ncbi:MAG: class I SAM-dependent methyltransferase [Methanogenium sp.]|jgi:ubiquinone/menaquinone biosynthesis C-methylase UbiE